MPNIPKKIPIWLYIWSLHKIFLANFDTFLPISVGYRDQICHKYLSYNRQVWYWNFLGSAIFSGKIFKIRTWNNKFHNLQALTATRKNLRISTGVSKKPDLMIRLFYNCKIKWNVNLLKFKKMGQLENLRISNKPETINFTIL